ncbi:hypothetical protein [Pseudomonas sp. SR18]|uniref:hypothetical protein n=1 Tax=Pseudomonas sp. SR18 TaxID=1461074 RepID=UPI002033CE05|nr:hypothetical protein [Pseudomonas sp. SR18]MCM2363770.1 hypothetical protein [Pseudomonas sp. SR18]
MKEVGMPQAKLRESFPAWPLFIGCGFIFVILVVISFTTLTSKESTLLGTLLTLLSVAIGWGISHYYASQDKQNAVQEVRDYEQRNLRMYALKAAEKVTNLSVELQRLSAYLDEELQHNEYNSPEEELFAKEERIQSAIHILGSLRSINDTSLSDWQGVIGEELDEQRRSDFARQEALIELEARMLTIETGMANSGMAAGLNAELSNLRREVRSISSGVNAGSFRLKKITSVAHVQSPCPACLNVISYKQKANDGDKKAIQCKSCETNLISDYYEDSGAILRVREILTEVCLCPECDSQNTILLDEWSTSSTMMTCEACGQVARVSRTGTGVDLRIVALKQVGDRLTSELIEKVRVSLPEQPWPKGIHLEVCKSLGITPSTTRKAIQQLIRTGVFKEQIDGVLCSREEKLRLMQTFGANSDM